MTYYDNRSIIKLEVKEINKNREEKTMTKRNMMKYAHKIAKELVKDTKNYQMALSLALKEIWRQVKLYNKKRFTQYSLATAYDRIRQPQMSGKGQQDDVYGVPAWVINNNLDSDESYAVLNECEGMSVVRETEKAQLVEFVTNYGKVTMWTPKSVLVA